MSVIKRVALGLVVAWLGTTPTAFAQTTPAPVVPDPFASALFDPAQEGRAKLFGHWGRFYESVPVDVNIRAFGGETINFATVRPACPPDTCLPFDLDTCIDGACGGDSFAPKGGDADAAFQTIMGELPDMQIPAAPSSGPGPEAAHPFELLARSAEALIDWWMPRLHAADSNALIQQAGLKNGLQFIMTSQGGSTGRNLTMRVLNFTGRPVSLGGAIALEPLKKDAQQTTMQAFAKLAGRQLPAKLDLSSYCLEFHKLPPIAGQVLRVASPAQQDRFASMKRLMAASNRLNTGGAYTADGNPTAYADSIKQWAIWSAQEKFTQSKFGDAFMSYTRKNVEASGQKWTRAIEDLVRQRVPNRWQDIVRTLAFSDIPVPQ